MQVIQVMQASFLAFGVIRFHYNSLRCSHKRTFCDAHSMSALPRKQTLRDPD